MRGIVILGWLSTLLAGPATAATEVAKPPSATITSASRPILISDAFAQTVEGKATGAVLVAKRGKVLWVKAIGDPKSGVARPGAGDIYDALSIGKTFTAIAIQRLANDGRVRLDAPIRSYLPEIPPVLGDITIQNCLDNASGWGPYVNDKGDLDPESATDLLRDLASAERPRRAGQYGYSNTGFQALGLVIERVTRMPFQRAIRELVFKPAKLQRTEFFGAPGLGRASVATGYIHGAPKGSPRNWPATWQLLGSAGIASTVQDLYRLNRTFIAGQGLGAAGRARMLADGAPTHGAAPFRAPGRTNITYGSGLYHWRDAAGRHVHFHGGDGDYGFHSLMFWREEDDLVIIGLFNSGDPAGTFDRGAFLDAVAAAAESGRVR